VKRLIGYGLSIVGGIATLWGGVALLTGSSQMQVAITPEFSPSALTVGLVGAAVLTVGLIWVRD
jgi:hypothetical protein